MDSDFRIDVNEVHRAIDLGEIIALYFPLLRKTLLMDTRTTTLDGPLIKVVPMATSPEERFRELVRLRPRFPKPESISIIPWPKYAASLVRLDVWDHIVRRFLELGPPDIVRQCDECLQQIYRAERKEIRRAITGREYETLWEAGGTPGGEGAEVDDDEEEAD
jgi:hypothetical protein